MNLFPSTYTGKPRRTSENALADGGCCPAPTACPAAFVSVLFESRAGGRQLSSCLHHRVKWPAQHSQVLQLAKPSPDSPQTPSLERWEHGDPSQHLFGLNMSCFAPAASACHPVLQDPLVLVRAQAFSSSAGLRET